MQRFCVHKSMPLISVPSQLNLWKLTHPIFIGFSLILFSHLCLRPTNILFNSGFPTKILYVFFISLHVICNLIFLDLTTVIILDEKYKLSVVSYTEINQHERIERGFAVREYRQPRCFKAVWRVIENRMRNESIKTELGRIRNGDIILNWGFLIDLKQIEGNVSNISKAWIQVAFPNKLWLSKYMAEEMWEDRGGDWESHK